MNRFSSSLTMALGSGGVTPMEMIGAYTVLANGGYKVEPYFIERITDRNNELIFQAPKPEFCDPCYTDYLPKPPPPEEQQIDSETTASITPEVEQDLIPQELNNNSEPASNTLNESYIAPRIMSHANNFLTVSMMQDVINQGTARRALSLNRTDLAGKTGTTNDYVDAWFTGFNSQVATTVWVGFDDPKSMGRGEAGSRAALPIWIDYMKDAMQGIEEDTKIIPSYIEEKFINASTGKIVDQEEPGALMEYFVTEELTPEYELLRELYPYSDELDANNPEKAPTFGLEQGVGGNLEILEEIPEPIDPNLRIIEDEEDTEGLF